MPAPSSGRIAATAPQFEEDFASLLSRLVLADHQHLLDVPGLGVLGAATIIGETAGVRRFKSKDAYARFNGTAPIPVWSGNKVRVRLSRGGNRRINTALHMAAVTQLRLGGEGTDYYDKLIAAGKTRTEALRLLRRRISDRVFAAMGADEARPVPEATSPPPTAIPRAPIPALQAAA